MSLFNPDSAPKVHIEILPPTAVAADVSLDVTENPIRLSVTTWAGGEPINCSKNGEGVSSDDFLEYTCYDCQYHAETITIDSEGSQTYINGHEYYLTGDVEVDSPCPCYESGLEDVVFPCFADHDGPDYFGGSDDNESEVDLPSDYMRYTQVLVLHPHECIPAAELIYQQRADVTPEGVVLTSNHKYPAINVYDSGRVCWGENLPGNNLQEMQLVYTESEANEDLTSAESHMQAYEALKRVEPTNPRPTAVGLSTYEHRGKALVCATATYNSSAFLLMSVSGCKTNGPVAYVPVYSYDNVAVDDDTIINVWATDVLSTNTRLLFYYSVDPDDAAQYNGQFIGQVPSTFDLTPCKSQVPQSSEQGVLVNS